MNTGRVRAKPISINCLVSRNTPMSIKPLSLRCDRCSNQNPTAKSYTTAGVLYTLCNSCREEFDRPATPNQPRDLRDIALEWLF